MYRVALLVETSRAVGRGLLTGIFRYARLHGSWSFHLLPGDVEQALPAMKAWRGTGIIARVGTERLERAVIAADLPIVAVSLSYRQRRANHPLGRVPEVVGEQMEIGRVAAEHLLSSGYRHFAYVGDARRLDWAVDRGQGFSHALEKEGYRCTAYWNAPAGATDWGEEQKHLIRWLRRLPRPVGIMTAMDVRGRQVLEACRAAGLNVPADIGVVGVDNDEFQCELTDPPLSSVRLNTEQAGYQAAEALHRLMRGQPTKRERIPILPVGVAQRLSTELDQTGDAAVAEGIRYIRSHASRPVQVSEVAAAVGLSRRSFEQRFRRATKRTVLTEIHRWRFEKVRSHLVDTKLSVTEICTKLGFSSSSYLARLCKRYLGETPAQWRRRHDGH